MHHHQVHEGLLHAQTAVEAGQGAGAVRLGLAADCRHLRGHAGDGSAFVTVCQEPSRTTVELPAKRSRAGEGWHLPPPPPRACWVRSEEALYTAQVLPPPTSLAGDGFVIFLYILL